MLHVLGLLESEQSLQAHGEAGGRRGHGRGGEEAHLGMNEARSSESCVDRQRLPVRRTAPHDAPPGQPRDRVHVQTPSGCLPARARQGQTRWRPAAAQRPASVLDSGDHRRVRSAGCRKGRRPCSRGVAQITSAEGKNLACLGGELHHQDGAEGEVRHDQNAHVRVLGQPAATPRTSRSSADPDVPTTPSRSYRDAPAAGWQ